MSQHALMLEVAADFGRLGFVDHGVVCGTFVGVDTEWTMGQLNLSAGVVNLGGAAISGLTFLFDR
ncbi:MULTISPECIES: hypothetical protein [Stenotrophomonas]|uniref:hypothetical protein n=1 Tax=Stenotrophomonas TaxID=40323 RepID=UPI00128F8E5E|nr:MULTISPECIES: hypothetical protein [Stenotrophomonas]